MRVRAFLETLQRSGLLEPDALRAVAQRCADAHGGKIPSDARVVADFFVRAGALTAWQAEKLLKGKYGGFFLGDKYRLLSHVGSGGMSSVYLAEHRVLGQRRAIKVLPKQRIAESSYLERFLLEARAIARLSHPNIVRAYDVDRDGDTYFIVMEYVAGRSLRDVVQAEGPLAPARVARYVAQAARGLAHAHEAGIIHRDVKPANLLLTDDDQIKILDLGLALLYDDDERASLTMAYNESVLGTADYLAPEQALDSHTVDQRADIYGLGCTMYCLLVGEPPFRGGSLAQRLARHQSQAPPSIEARRPDCPRALVRICMRMLEKNPDDRYPTARAVAEDLEAWLAQGSRPSGEPAALAAPREVREVEETAARSTRARPTASRSLRAGWWSRLWRWAGRKGGEDEPGASDTVKGPAARDDETKKGPARTVRAGSGPRSGSLNPPAPPSAKPTVDERAIIELGTESQSGLSSSIVRRRRRRAGPPIGLVAILVGLLLALLVTVLIILVKWT